MSDRRYAQFDLASLPAAYTVEGRGLVLANAVGGALINSFARGDVLVDGTEPRAIEVVFDTTDATLIAAVGFCAAGSNLGQSLGFASDTLGWRLDAGQVLSGNTALATGLAVVGRRVAVTMYVNPTPGGFRMQFYSGRTMLWQTTWDVAGAWHLAIGLAGLQPGATRAYLNAGQYAFSGPGAATRGWSLPRTQLPVQRIADRDLLTGVADAPANARYEGVLGEQGLTWSADLDFWPMRGAGGASPGTFARLVVADRDGRVPALASAAVVGAPVRIRLLPDGTALSAAEEWFNGIVQSADVDAEGDLTLELRDPLPELDEPLLRTPLLPFQAQVETLRPQPLVIGAVASAPCIPVNSDGTSQWISDAPVEISLLRESGDPLATPADFTRDATRQQLRLASPPVGPLTADVSSLGLRTGGSSDLWAGLGMPFTGVNNGAPNGLTRGGTAGLAVFRTAALANPNIGGGGKPSYSSGVVFPNAQRGAVATLGAGATLAPGAAARYRIVALVSASYPIVISSAPNLGGVMAVVEATGYSEGIITNASGAAAQVFLCAQADGSGGEGPIVSSFEVLPLDGNGDPRPATLEQALREILSRANLGRWWQDDAWAIDAATGYAGVGLYADDPALTARAAIQPVLDSYTASSYVGRAGRLRVERLRDPAAEAPALRLDAGDISAARTLPDTAPGLSAAMGFRPNARVLGESDLVTDMVDLPMPTRRELVAEYRGIAYAGPKLAARYAEAERAAPARSLFWDRADAQREINRIAALYSVERQFVFLEIEGRLDLRPMPGQVVEVDLPENGLLAKRLLVLGVTIDSVNGDIQLRLWG